MPAYAQTFNCCFPAILAVFLLVTSFPLGTSLASSKFKFTFAVADFIPHPAMGRIVVENDVSSNTECSLLCVHTASCVSFAYANATRDCQLFSSVLDADHAAENKPGYNYYVRWQEKQTIGQACSGDSDCNLVNHAECRDHVCQCVIGYHFFPGPGTCVKKCWRYGGGFYKVPGRCLNGNNDIDVWGSISFQDCWRLCLQDPGCRTFEHSVTRCFGSYSTKLEKEGDWKMCGILSYYQRDCA